LNFDIVTFLARICLEFIFWKSNFGFVVFAISSLCSDFSDFSEVFKHGKSLSAEI